MRTASAALASAFGLRLLSYEGSMVGIPALDEAINATTATIISANRAAAYGAVLQRDFEKNWAPLGGGEFNFFALSSQYGEDTPVPVFQWGLAEDLGSLDTAAKYQAVCELAGGGLQHAATDPPRHASERLNR